MSVIQSPFFFFDPSLIPFHRPKIPLDHPNNRHYLIYLLYMNDSQPDSVEDLDTQTPEPRKVDTFFLSINDFDIEWRYNDGIYR